MASFIRLTLDLTPPKIEIYAPSYTTKTAKTEITVASNQILEEWQDIYIIDHLGIRHDLTFRYEEDKYVGVLYFEGYPYGVTTVYARVMDDVGNISPLVSKTINIVSSETLSISVSESVRKVKVSNEAMGKIEIDNEAFGVVKVNTEEAK